MPAGEMFFPFIFNHADLCCWENASGRILLHTHGHFISVNLIKRETATKGMLRKNNEMKLYYPTSETSHSRRSKGSHNNAQRRYYYSHEVGDRIFLRYLINWRKKKLPLTNKLACWTSRKRPAEEVDSHLKASLRRYRSQRKAAGQVCKHLS